VITTGASQVHCVVPTSTSEPDEQGRRLRSQQTAKVRGHDVLDEIEGRVGGLALVTGATSSGRRAGSAQNDTGCFHVLQLQSWHVVCRLPVSMVHWMVYLRSISSPRVCVIKIVEVRQRWRIQVVFSVRLLSPPVCARKPDLVVDAPFVVSSTGSPQLEQLSASSEVCVDSGDRPTCARFRHMLAAAFQEIR
jgi:hypothetical protein